MKKFILSAIAAIVFANPVFADGNDVRLTQRNSANTADVTRDIHFPPGNANSVLVMNGSSIRPQAATLAGGLTFDGTNLTTSAIPQSSITGLSSALAGKASTATTINGYPLSSDITLSKTDLSLGNVDNTSDISKPISTATQTALNGKANTSHGHAIGDVTGLQTALDGKALLAHTHAIADVTNLQSSLDAKAGASATTTALANRPTVYLAQVQKANVKMYANVNAIAGGAGQVIFYLTDNNASNGNALYANVYDATIDFEVNDNTSNYRYAWTLSGDKKTLTATVTRSTSTGLISLLGLNLLSAPTNAPNGTSVRVTLWGD